MGWDIEDVNEDYWKALEENVEACLNLGLHPEGVCIDREKHEEKSSKIKD